MDYRDAGVDISAADEAKSRIKALARGTFNASVLSEIGSFGGMFRPDLGRYEDPVLVASTDGVRSPSPRTSTTRWATTSWPTA